MSDDEALKIALAMRAANHSWYQISRRTGRTDWWLRGRIDPAYIERRKQQRREWRRTKRAPPKNIRQVQRRGHPTPEEIAARKAEIPEDTRPLSARLLGDPLPGRSALDRMQERRT